MGKKLGMRMKLSSAPLKNNLFFRGLKTESAFLVLEMVLYSQYGTDSGHCRSRTFYGSYFYTKPFTVPDRGQVSEPKVSRLQSDFMREFMGVSDNIIIVANSYCKSDDKNN